MYLHVTCILILCTLADDSCAGQLIALLFMVDVFEVGIGSKATIVRKCQTLEREKKIV